jgi:PKD repeat protein
MADYWRATGTRPSASVKFSPWDSEESGTWGSIDYVQNNIPPDEEEKVRAYFNMDPCAGAYPAYYHGIPVPGNRVPEVLQLADPTAFPPNSPERKRIEAFNARAMKPGPNNDVVDEIFARMDSQDPGLLLPDNSREQIFTQEQRESEVVTALGGLAAFSSDYANFEAVGIPIFNLFPDQFGPHSDGTPASAEGATILHTPRDNVLSVNAATHHDQTGRTASEGWAKGQEMCAQTEAWYMLQPEMGGGQVANLDVVAYYEALPNEVVRRDSVKFDATGSYQYSQLATRLKADDSRLRYQWDFGDGQTAEGRVVEHRYDRIGRYESKLTVTSLDTGATDTMTLPILVVVPSTQGPDLKPPAAEDEDGTFPLEWAFAGSTSGFDNFSVEEASDVRTELDEPAEGALEPRWVATREPAEAAALQPWQQSNSGTSKARGPEAKNGSASFWTGVSPQSWGSPPTNARSILTLNQPITVERDERDFELGYWSLFKNEGDDQGRVEVAIEDDNPDTPLRWQAVDVIQAVNTAAGSTDPYIFQPGDPESLTGDFEFRRINLGGFKGRKLLLRFVYVAGPDNRAASQPAGWYIDDIRVMGGTWRSIGTTTTKNFEVFGKAAGTYWYRVKAVYTGGVETAPSNVEKVTVTRGSPPRGGPAESCVEPRGFRSLRVTPRGGGLRVSVKRRLKQRFDVAVIQESRGSTIVRNRRVASFNRRTGSLTWNGRARGGKRVASGFYVVRFSMAVPGRQKDVQRLVVQRSRGRFLRRPTFSRRDTCRTLRRFRLSRAVFGGRNRRPLNIAFRLTQPAEVSVEVLRRGRAIRTFAATERAPRVTFKVNIASAALARGDYTIRIRVRRGGSTSVATLVARRL